jgi:hypothetical protein
VSFLPADITVIAAAIENLVGPVLFMQRNIGGFIADVTIEEDHTDEVMITEHPVEQGAAITDHAYKVPAKVTVTAGWSNSSFAALGNPFYVQLVYNQMLALQASLQPFSVTTGKRIYQNMLIRRISTKTDEKSENMLMASFELQEILIASTQTVSSATANPSAMADPVNNAGTTDRGSVNPTMSQVTIRPVTQ